MYRKHSDFDILSAWYFAFLIVCIAIIYDVLYTCMQISFKNDGEGKRRRLQEKWRDFTIFTWGVFFCSAPVENMVLAQWGHHFCISDQRQNLDFFLSNKQKDHKIPFPGQKAYMILWNLASYHTDWCLSIFWKHALYGFTWGWFEFRDQMIHGLTHFFCCCSLSFCCTTSCNGIWCLSPNACDSGEKATDQWRREQAQYLNIKKARISAILLMVQKSGIHQLMW